MPCFHPIKAWRSRKINPSTGKRGIVFDRSQAYTDLELQVPCGQCIGCRLERSRQWAIRCVHEAQLWEKNCFITLTFNDENLPKNNSLDVRHFQLFMKRLRKKYGEGIRFFHCGEYGETFGRPHYHACLFNFDFPDKVLFKKASGDTNLYISPSLSELWSFGFSTVGDVTFESAAYVARYITKKITGDAAYSHYNTYDHNTGEVIEKKPEYVTMSRRPGIASGWYDRFKDDVYPYDEVVIRGKKMKPPKFYDRRFEHEYPSDFIDVKRKRNLSLKNNFENCTIDRLKVREKLQLLRFEQLKRELL